MPTRPPIGDRIARRLGAVASRWSEAARLATFPSGKTAGAGKDDRGTERPSHNRRDPSAVRKVPFVVGIDRDGTVLAVRAVGELDLATAPLLEEALWRAFERREASAIVVDLSAVGFIDLVGMRVLVAAATHSRQDGDRLRIRCGSGAVRRMIETTGIEDSLPLIA